jgi:hypothetical protein
MTSSVAEKTLRAGPPSQRRRAAEQRMIGRALGFWDDLRAGRSLPSLADVDAASPPFDVANTYLIEIRAAERDDTVIRAGQEIITALGRDPTGFSVLEVLPSATDKGLSYCRAAVQVKKPIADVGQFTNVGGRDVRYRSMLLPLSQDQETVDFVFGVFSYIFME